ncbi:MAG: DinB family protein [candidate division Zixibacteria bacterium]|nr:DinB family protein [candidate division Zixibacteria bacterium]
MEVNRKIWNQNQKKLRQALTKSDNHNETIELFLGQHAMVHSSRMSGSGLHSFEDEILGDLSEETIRYIPPKFNHSIAWIIWHLARIEDVTMNLLVTGTPQCLIRNDWLKKLKINICHTGNAMSDDDVAQLSSDIEIEALKAYRIAVGRNTSKIVKKLKQEDFKKSVDPSRLQRIWDEKAMLENAAGIVRYWGRRDIAGLLLMPPTRHCFLHLNEARRVKERCV